MAENFLNGSQAIEAEIAQLQRMIEEKRNQLEEKSGIIEEKELVRGALQEMISQTEPQTVLASSPLASSPSPMASFPDGKSYLDRLDDESVARLNQYIEKIGQQGIVKTMNQVMAESPFIIDALHDALVDKLYEQLKAEGLIK